MGRGVVQLSGYLDLVLASLLGVGAFARLRYAQGLYLLPISLFGMSVAAAALPDLARDRDVALGALRERTSAALRRVAFFVVPSFVAFLAIGDVLVAGLYRAGEFGAAEVRVVALILSGYSLGLLASTASRVYQSAFFALRDTVTPARAAIVRVAVALAAGAALMLQFEPVTLLGVTIPAGAFGSLDALGLPLGPVGLAAGASLGAWVEWALLKRQLKGRIGGIGAGPARLARMFAAALTAAAAAYGASRSISAHALVEAAAAAGVFGAVYLGVGAALGLEQAAALLKRVRRRAA